jgi:hypothetical protein
MPGIAWLEEAEKARVWRCARHWVWCAPGRTDQADRRTSTTLGVVRRWDDPLEPPPGSPGPVDVGVGQWSPGMNFGEFSERTLDANYEPINGVQ